MKYNFNVDIDRKNSDSIKWNYFDDDVLPLWVADMDFSAPEFIIKDLVNRVSHGIFGYALPQESTKQAIQTWLNKRHNWTVALDDILILPGVIPGFNAAAKAFTKPGDSLLFQTPAYHPFFQVAENTQLIQYLNPLSKTADGFYFPNFDAIQSSISPNTRLFILCNPHNPVGRVFTQDELSRIGEICLEHNIIICSDEIHSDIVFTGHHHIPIASLSKPISNITVTLISASKTFNIAGLKSAAAIITNPALRENFNSAAAGIMGSPNLLGETALRSAYLNGESWLEHLITYLAENRELAVDYIKSELKGINVYSPEGTYLAWLDCSDTGLDDPAKHFLHHAKVGLNNGDWFGEEYKSYVRLNFGCKRSTLLSALDRIKSSLSP